MTNKTKPAEIADEDLDVSGGLSPDMAIKTASTSDLLDGVRATGVRKLGLRENGVRKTGVRLNGVRLNGIRENGTLKKG